MKTLVVLFAALNIMACAHTEKPVEATQEAPATPPPAPAAQDLTGRYQQDSYLEKDPHAITIEINTKMFTAYSYGQKKNPKTGKTIMDTWQVATGEWALNGSELTLKTKTGSCIYTYNQYTEVATPPTVGRGFKLVSKTGKNTNFCRKLFSDTQSKALQ